MIGERSALVYMICWCRIIKWNIKQLVVLYFAVVLSLAHEAEWRIYASVNKVSLVQIMDHTCISTHWGRAKMTAISEMNPFSWMKMWEFVLKFHRSLFLRVQLAIFLALIQIMVWRLPGDKPLPESMMANLPTHTCVTRPQWVIWAPMCLMKR